MLGAVRPPPPFASGGAPRNLETRLSEAAMPRELRPLIHAFNEALDRLQQGYRVQQEFLASAARSTADSTRSLEPANQYLDSYRLNPQGYAVALTSRGKVTCPLRKWSPSP